MNQGFSLPRRTFSLCPVCGRRIEAEYRREGDSVFLYKECPKDGSFSTVVWRGSPDITEWLPEMPEALEAELGQCPTQCGLCSSHLAATCCVLVEVTERCNLNCDFCFAGGPGAAPEPSAEQLTEVFDELVRGGRFFLQLTGGEPTLRDDLPRLVKIASRAGFQYIQLNTNGIRLAEDEKYTAALAKAGLSFVFLQFDGTDDTIYKKLRGRPLLELKKKAIENCAKYNLGVILVPMLVPGVNTESLWDIVSFGVSLSPVVRGVHFQPVSYFGRKEKAPSNDERFTLAELLSGLERQSAGQLRVRNFTPSRCDHALCGFHGGFTVSDGRLQPAAAERAEKKGCRGSVTAEANRNYIGTRWLPPKEPCCCGANSDDLSPTFDEFLQQLRSRSFTVTAMAFQDIWNLDLDRLRRCSLHLWNKGRIVPFCANYLGLAEVQR